MQNLILFIWVTLLPAVLSAQNFTDVANLNGITTGFGIPQFEGGGGISFADFNGDGWDDLTFCNQPGDTMAFYVNQNGLFSKVDPPFVVEAAETKQVVWVDYDNDGDKDLFVTCYQDSNRLYQNDNMIFTDVTDSAGIQQSLDPTFGADFGDYDKDGDLDLYLSNYGGLPDLLGEPNVMYRNDGNGTFTDVPSFTGTGNGNQQTFASVFFDYNNDGWLDLYVINDRVSFENALYYNNGNGTFSDSSISSGTNISIYAMNAGVGDYDNNGYQDIYVTNIGPSACFKNLGNGSFIDEASTNGTIFNRVGWAANFFDFDNDLDLDLYVCSMTPVFAEPNAMYVNDGSGIFSEPLFMSGGLGGKDTAVSHVNAIGDFNQDGLPDIAVNNSLGYPSMIWSNQTTNSNHWFKLQLTGSKSNRDALGAWVEVWINGQKYIRTTHANNGYLNQNSNTLTVGTGSHSSIDSLVIKWPFPNSKEVVPGSAVSMSAVNLVKETCTMNGMVLNTNDSGFGSLRRVMECAQPGDTIPFDTGLAGDTICLASAGLLIDKDIVLISTLTPGVTIKSLVAGAITIKSDVQVELHGFDLIGGPSGTPTALDNAGNLLLYEMNVRRHPSAVPGSLLVNNTGTMTVESSNVVEE